MRVIQKVVLAIIATLLIIADAYAGRWLSRDPIEDGAGFVRRDPKPQPDFSLLEGQPNLYVFLGNDGINNVDLLGLLNIVRLGFQGAGETTGNWLTGLGPSQIFTSRDKSAAMKYILKQLDANGDGKINDCDDSADIRITGYSWGGWTALQTAHEINTTKKIQSTGNKHRWVKLGLLDPVDTLRGGSGSISPNVYFALNLYQQNGCYGSRCPGPSSWYSDPASKLRPRFENGRKT